MSTLLFGVAVLVLLACLVGWALLHVFTTLDDEDNSEEVLK